MAKKKKRSNTTGDDGRRLVKAGDVNGPNQSGVGKRSVEVGDTVFIGVNSHAKNGVQVDAFGLLWKDGVYPEYDEAFISRNTGALSEIELALRALMHAIRTSNPENTLIVYTKFPRVSECITAARRTIRGCRLPESPDAATVIKMIKERRGCVIGHVICRKEDVDLGFRATALAIASRRRAMRTAINQLVSQPSARQAQPKNNHKREPNSDNVSFFLDPYPATMDTRVTSINTFTNDIHETSTAPARPHLINGKHPDRIAMLSDTASSSNTDINMVQSDIHSNQRNSDFGPVTVSSMESNSNIFTPNAQDTSSSSHLINGMHPDRNTMLSRPELSYSNIASSSSASSSAALGVDIGVPQIHVPPLPPINRDHNIQQPLQHAMGQTVLHDRGSQASSNPPMIEPATALNNDSSVARLPRKRKRKGSQRPGQTDRAEIKRAKELFGPIPCLSADTFEDAVDRGWPSDNEYEHQQQRPIASSSSTPDNVSYQPTADNAPQQPISDSVSQQPSSDNAPQQPISDNVSQQPVSNERNQGWLSWLRSIFF